MAFILIVDQDIEFAQLIRRSGERLMETINAVLDLAQLEGRTQRQKNPHPRGSLAYAAWVCARLGGWTGYYGKPGPLVTLEGWLEGWLDGWLLGRVEGTLDG